MAGGETKDLSQSQKSNLRETFELFDKDGDGEPRVLLRTVQLLDPLA
jgi:Ca2+-binding EF-hand superfamily protein